jgi:hypothetical protein
MHSLIGLTHQIPNGILSSFENGSYSCSPVCRFAAAQILELVRTLASRQSGRHIHSLRSLIRTHVALNCSQFALNSLRIRSLLAVFALNSLSIRSLFAKFLLSVCRNSELLLTRNRSAQICFDKQCTQPSCMNSSIVL